MIKVAQLSSTHRGQALAVALMTAGIVALAAVGGYELGTAAARAHSAPVQVVQPLTCTAPEAPPATGFQP